MKNREEYSLNLSLEASHAPKKGIWASRGIVLKRKQSKEYFNLKVGKKKLTRLCVLMSLVT